MRRVKGEPGPGRRGGEFEGNPGAERRWGELKGNPAPKRQLVELKGNPAPLKKAKKVFRKDKIRRSSCGTQRLKEDGES